MATDMPSQYQGKDDGVNRLGSFLGIMGQSAMTMDGSPAEIEAGDRRTAELFGQRIATAVERWSKVPVAA
jgi:NAD(P)H dehydrogenase (quinone)